MHSHFKQHLEDHIGASLSGILYLNSCHCLGSLLWGVIPGCVIMEVMANAIGSEPSVLSETEVDCKEGVEQEWQNQEQATPEVPSMLKARASTDLNTLLFIMMLMINIKSTHQIGFQKKRFSRCENQISNFSHQPILLSTCHSTPLGRSVSLNKTISSVELDHSVFLGSMWLLYVIKPSKMEVALQHCEIVPNRIKDIHLIPG